MDHLKGARRLTAWPFRQQPATPAAPPAAGPSGPALPALLRAIPNVGARVLLRGSLDEVHGCMTGRTTYADGTPGATVELESGNVVTVPLSNLVACGVRP